MNSIFPERNFKSVLKNVPDVPLFLPARAYDRINPKTRHDGSSYVEPIIYRNDINLNNLFGSKPEYGINNLRLKQMQVYHNGINKQIQFNKENLDLNQPNRHGFRQVGMFNRNRFN